MSQVRTSGCASSSCSWSLLPCSPCAHGNSLTCAVLLILSFLVIVRGVPVPRQRNSSEMPVLPGHESVHGFSSTAFLCPLGSSTCAYTGCAQQKCPRSSYSMDKQLERSGINSFPPLLSPQHAFSPCNLAFSALAKVKFPVHQGFRVVVRLTQTKALRGAFAAPGMFWNVLSHAGLGRSSTYRL